MLFTIYDSEIAKHTERFHAISIRIKKQKSIQKNQNSILSRRVRRFAGLVVQVDLIFGYADNLTDALSMRR